MKTLLRFVNPVRVSGMLTLGLAILVAAVSLYLYFARPQQSIAALKLSTGRKIALAKNITRFLLESAPQYGMEFQLIDTEGSEDSLARVQRGELDLAVVKGGMHLADRDNVRQVTALDVEMIHLLVRDDRLADQAKKDIGALRGLRINVNKPTTGTYHWSLDILDFAGIQPKSAASKGNFTPVHLGNPELLDRLERIEKTPENERAGLLAELPDAILFADTVPSPIVRRLVKLAHYRLVPLEFGPAYVQERHASPSRDEKLDANVMIEVGTIPAYTYSVSPAVPPRGCPSIGVRRLLIAHKDVPDEAVVRCLRMIYDSPSRYGLEIVDWNNVRFEYGMHGGARWYDDDRRQVLQNTIKKVLERLASVLGGIVGCILALYGYYRYRRLLRFEHYFHEIRRIELIARGKEEDADAPTGSAERLAFLRGKLADLRTAAIAEFAQGRLQGESLILSIFTLLQNTSTNLAELLSEANARESAAAAALK